ncbi:hypothetical protein AC249_AIPGENE20739 [Exaiptasia diaphana]|nr:hypothetical protein AC249_AIPGENE20739 [Exaiptasia diaphana]
MKERKQFYLVICREKAYKKKDWSMKISQQAPRLPNSQILDSLQDKLSHLPEEYCDFRKVYELTKTDSFPICTDGVVTLHVVVRLACPFDP